MDFLKSALSYRSFTTIKNDSGDDIYVHLKYTGLGTCGWGERFFKDGEIATDEYTKAAGGIIITVKGKKTTQWKVDMGGEHTITWDRDRYVLKKGLDN